MALVRANARNGLAVMVAGMVADDLRSGGHIVRSIGKKAHFPSGKTGPQLRADFRRGKSGITPPSSGKRHKGHNIKIADLLSGGHGVKKSNVRANPTKSRNSGTSIGSFKRSTKKVKRKPSMGINLHYRSGGTTSSNTSQFMGHASSPMEQMMSQAWLAVVKKLMVLAEFDVGDPNVPLNAALNDKLFVTLQAYEGQGVIGFTYAFTGPADTMNTLVAWLMAVARPWNLETSSTSDQVAFQGIRYEPLSLATGATTVNPPSYLPLRFLHVTLGGSSLMKVQNRSVGDATNNNANAVDAEPLRVVEYEGKGTGMIYIQPSPGGTTPSFVANSGIGGFIFAKPAAPNVGAPSELPAAQCFDKVSRTSTTKIFPGDIKTSFLKLSFRGTFNDLFTRTHPHGNGTSNNVRKPFGEFRIMGFEKQIKYLDVSDIPITTVWQLDVNIYATVNIKRAYQSTSSFVAQYGQTY